MGTSSSRARMNGSSLDDDVGRATHWLGQLWVRTLARRRVEGATVHTGAMVCRPWSKLVCFAGLGPGEVSIGERKAVGISQRRTRLGARFQCALYHRWHRGAGGGAGRPPPLARRAPASVAESACPSPTSRPHCSPGFALVAPMGRRPGPHGRGPRSARSRPVCAQKRADDRTSAVPRACPGGPAGVCGVVPPWAGVRRCGPWWRPVGVGLARKWGEVVDSGGSLGLRWGHVGRRGEAAQAPPISVDPTEAGRTTDSR